MNRSLFARFSSLTRSFRFPSRFPWHSYTGKHRPWPEWLEDGDGVGDAGASGQGQAGMGTSGEGDERVPAPLEQPADVSGDRRTIQRRLDSHLYLILRSKEAKGGHWFFPSVPHEATETIRQTCERALATFVDSSAVDTYFIGNGPCGMVPLRPDAAEDKVFLIPVELIKGSPQIKVETKVADFAWAAKDEMGDYFKNEATLAYLDRLLQDKSDYYGFATSQTY